ncbi:MAG: YdcH family protein [Pseudomonadota bacterium]
MSIQGRIAELSTKHRELDQKIQHAQKQAAVDTLQVSELKRRKLRIKEELTSLER